MLSIICRTVKVLDNTLTTDGKVLNLHGDVEFIHFELQHCLKIFVGVRNYGVEKDKGNL